MKREITLLLISSFFVISAAAQSMIPVKWSSIQGWVNNNPAHVRELVNRLGKQSVDSGLTMKDKVLAFYGQSYLNHSGEDYFVFMMKDSLRNNINGAAMRIANDVLKINCLNIDALSAKIEVYKRQASDTASASKDLPSNWEQSATENRRLRLFKVIAATGNGTIKYPYAVTKLSDEYNFVRDYLGIDDITSHEIEGNYDVLHLGKQSGYYKRSVIFFDATRIYDLEKEMSDQKVDDGETPGI